MLEALVALGVGALLAHLLASPRASKAPPPRIDPREAVDPASHGATALDTPAPTVAPAGAATAPASPVSPRKATATVTKFK